MNAENLKCLTIGVAEERAHRVRFCLNSETVFLDADAAREVAATLMTVAGLLESAAAVQ